MHHDTQKNGDDDTLHVVIVGAALGGLACAIACRRCDPPLRVTLVERTPKPLAVGAGIQVPPNTTRIMKHFSLVAKMKKEGGAITLQRDILRRYESGRVLGDKPCGKAFEENYGAEWLYVLVTTPWISSDPGYRVILRADYQELLLREAVRLGTDIIMDAEVVSVKESEGSGPTVVLRSGIEIRGDAVIGADGTINGLIQIEPADVLRLKVKPSRSDHRLRISSIGNR